MKKMLFCIALIMSLPVLAETLSNDKNNYCSIYYETLSNKMNLEDANLRLSNGENVKIFPENLEGWELKALNELEKKGYQLVKENANARVNLSVSLIRCREYHGDIWAMPSLCSLAEWVLSAEDLQTNEVYKDKTFVANIPAIGEFTQGSASTRERVSTVIRKALPTCVKR